METKQYYKDRLTKILTFAGIAFFVATSLFAGLMSETGSSILPAFALGIFFSGLPSGWTIAGKAFGGWIITGIGGILLLFIRLMVSLIIGIFALPIQILDCVSKMRTAPEEPSSNE